MIDYIFVLVLVLIAAPFIFGFNDNETATAFFVILGVGGLALVAVTRFVPDGRETLATGRP